MTYRSKINNAFCSGVIALACVLSLWQDWIGKEDFVRLAQTHWIDASISVPVALVFLVVSMVAVALIWLDGGAQ